MKKFNKRFLSLMIIMSMLLSPLPAIADKPEVQKSSSTVNATSESDFEFDSAKGEITGYKGNEKDLVIPSKIDGKQVYGLGKSALNEKGLTSVVLPEGMTYLKWGALGKNDLTSVKMPSTMRRIEAYAFVLNKQLKHVELNKGLKSIETFAFSNLPSLSGEMDIPSTVEWIGPKAFFKSNLITLNIKGDENSAPIVLKNALSDHLNYINLENERKDITIDYTAFCNREGKDKVTVTAPVNKINITASSVKEVDDWIKNNINIQYATYYVKASDNSGHSDIKNPVDIKWNTAEKFVKNGEFEVTGVMDKDSIRDLPSKDGYMLANPDNCQGSNTISLKFVVTSPSETEKEYEFDSQKGVITKYLGNKTELVIPDEIDGVKVKGIASGAFRNKNLTSVTLPKNLEFTEFGSFTNNNFSKIVFPDTMKSIGSYSFNNNKNLREVVFNEGLKEIGNHAFINDKVLSGNLVIPSTVEWIGPSAFRYTNVNKFKIKGGKDSAKLTLKNNLGQEIKEFELEDIQKQLYVDFTSFCNNQKTNLITTEKPTDVGVSSPEELEKWIKDNVNIQFMSSYQKAGEDSTAELQKFKTGKYDEYVNIDTVWEPIADFKDNKAIAKAKMQEITDETFPQKPGFIMNKVSNYGGTNTLEFAFNIVDKPKEDDSKFVASDFNYEGSTITGFSKTGLKKIETLKDVNLPEKSSEGTVITSIGNEAFKQKGIESVSIPETVKSIGNLAFQMNELTEIKLPSKLETAGAASFATNKIKEVTIPGTLKEIPSGMFSTNISTKIVIENGVEKIGQSAFTGCKIESLTLPASVKSVGRMAFSGGAKEQTGKLKELILNEGLEKIDTKAFQNNILKEVKIPVSLNSIKDDSFKGNAQVVELQTTNEDHLKFNTEKSLKNQKFVLVEDNSKFIDSDFTYDGSKITGFSEEGLKKLETSKNVELPEKSSDGTAITTIGKAAFRNKGIESVTIPETVTTIEDFAFNNNKLTTINLGKNLKKLGTSVFGVNQITKVTIPANIGEIPGGLFTMNPITELTIEDGIKKIGQSAFVGNELTELTIPKSVESIGRMAFKSGNRYAKTGTLKKLTLNEGLKEIDSKAFVNNILEEVNVPSSLEKIADDSFQGNVGKDQKDVVFLYTKKQDHLKLNNEKSIKNQKFIFTGKPVKEEFTQEDFTYKQNVITGFSNSGMAKFAINKDVVLPDKNPDGTVITEIGEKAFIIDFDSLEIIRGCLPGISDSPEGIKTIKLPSKLEKIGREAFRYNALNEVDFPNTLKVIDTLAFSGNQLHSVSLPDSVTDLGVGVFSLNKIETVKLSNSLTEVNEGMFSYNEIKKLELNEGIKKVGKSAFRGNLLEELKLPDSLVTIETKGFQANLLKEIIIPKNVKTIGKDAFKQKEKHRFITKVVLPEGLESIGVEAFSNNNLVEVNLPKSLTSIADNAFKNSLDLNNPDAQVRVVKLFTKNPDHLKFNNEKSLVNQKVIFNGIGEIVPVPEIKAEDIEKEVVKQGEKIDVSDNIKNLPEKATAKDVTEPKIDTNKPGEYTAKVEIIFENGSKRIVEIPVVVEKKETTPSEPETPEEIKDTDTLKEIFEKIPATRIAGRNRQLTAVEVSKTLFQKADTVIITSSDKMVDSLASSPYGVGKNAPTLLVEKDSIMDEVLQEIKRLNPSKIIIAGGKLSVSEKVENQIKQLGIKQQRIAGHDRFETAVKLGEQVRANSDNKKEIILVNGFNNIDALTAGSLAAKLNIPVLLTDSDQLNKDTEKAIKGWGIEKVTIIGGKTQVSEAIKVKLQESKITVERLAGRTRVDTALEVAKAVNSDPDKVIFANKTAYPDALIAPYLSKTEQAPIMLIDKDEASVSVKQYLRDNKIKESIILGGKLSIEEYK